MRKVKDIHRLGNFSVPCEYWWLVYGVRKQKNDRNILNKRPSLIDSKNKKSLKSAKKINLNLSRQIIPGKWMRLETKRLTYLKSLKTIHRPGLYAIFKVKPYICFYVGQSKNIAKRLIRHLTHDDDFRYKDIQIKIRIDKKKFERFSLEQRFINKLKPALNKSLVK